VETKLYRNYFFYGFIAKAIKQPWVAAKSATKIVYSVSLFTLYYFYIVIKTKKFLIVLN